MWEAHISTYCELYTRVYTHGNLLVGHRLFLLVFGGNKHSERAGGVPRLSQVLRSPMLLIYENVSRGDTTKSFCTLSPFFLSFYWVFLQNLKCSRHLSIRELSLVFANIAESLMRLLLNGDKNSKTLTKFTSFGDLPWWPPCKSGGRRSADGSELN